MSGLGEDGPIGAVLAGGRGRRLGGDKATVELEGRSLVSYPIAVLREVLGEVVLVAKADTQLPELEGVGSVWVEPDESFHPLAGIVHALRMARGRPVFVCAADLPLLTADVVRAVVAVDPGDAPAVLPVAGGRPQPLAALYTPAALAGLAEYPPDAPTRDVVLALGPKLVAVADEDAFFNVNAPEDLLQAAALLSTRGRPPTPSGGTQPNVTA